MNVFLRVCGVALLAAAFPSAAAASGPLRPGEVSIAVSRQGPPASFAVLWWEPRVGVPLRVTASARLTPAQVRAKAHLFIRYHEGRRPCGSRASDTASGRLFAVIDRRRADTLQHSARTPTVTFRAPGNVRFCSWIARTASEPARPVVQDVEAYDRLFGAAIRVTPTGGDWRPISTEVRSTDPFRYAIGDDGCGSAFARGFESAGPSADGLHRHSSVWWGRCPLTAWTFAAGGLSLTAAEREADPPPVRGFGTGCVIGWWHGERLFEAARYLQAVGCRVGRVSFSPAPGGTPTGAVYGSSVHGVGAALVPKGTAVDLEVDGRPAGRHASPSAQAVAARYGGAARKGETVLTSYAGPVVPGLPGVVLLRYFIPSESAAGGLLRGDRRTFSTDLEASHRAALYWDTTTGKVVFRITRSCTAVNVPEVDLGQAVLDWLARRRFSLPPLKKEPKRLRRTRLAQLCLPALKLREVPRDAVWRDSDTIRVDNLVSVDSQVRALRVRLSILNSFTNAVPWGAWSVDNELAITPTAAGFSVAIEGNGYPAIEGYFHPTAEGVETILRRDVEHPVVDGRGPLSDGRNGGNAALDGKSWADCVTDPVSLHAMTCTNRRNDNVWTTRW